MNNSKLKRIMELASDTDVVTASASIIGMPSYIWAAAFEKTDSIEERNIFVFKQCALNYYVATHEIDLSEYKIQDAKDDEPNIKNTIIDSLDENKVIEDFLDFLVEKEVLSVSYYGN